MDPEPIPIPYRCLSFCFERRHTSNSRRCADSEKERICRDAMTSPGRLESRSPPPYDPSVDSCRSSEEKDKNCHICESCGRIESGILFSNVLFHSPRPRLSGYRIVLHMSLSHALLYSITHYNAIWHSMRP